MRIVILLLITFLGVSKSEAGALPEQVANFGRSAQEYQTGCIDKSPSLDASDCEALKGRLGFLKGEIQSKCNEVPRPAPAPATDTAPSCINANGSLEPVNLKELSNLTGTVDAVKPAAPEDPLAQKPVECKEPEVQLSCSKMIGCNVARSLFAFFGGSPASNLRAQVINYFTKKASEETKECLNSKGRTDCFSELLNGFIVDLLSPVIIVWKGLKWTHQKLWTWKLLEKEENHSRDAIMAASKQSPRMIELFKKNPGEFFKVFFTEFGSTVARAAQGMFGCRQWSGIPHFSPCTEPLSSWKCATCDQKMNVICGVTGIFGSEFGPFLISPAIGMTELIETGLESGAAMGAAAACALDKINKNLPVDSPLSVGNKKKIDEAVSSCEEMNLILKSLDHFPEHLRP